MHGRCHCSQEGGEGEEGRKKVRKEGRKKERKKRKEGRNEGTIDEITKTHRP